jgi:serine/threonine-protein kinase
VNTDTFLDHLRQGQFLSADQLALVVDRFGDVTSAGPLADFLLGEGLLTPFQVRHLLAGEWNRLVLGQYRLFDELGQGGMGKVFKARHVVMGRLVALKVLFPGLQADPEARALFDREIRAVTHLHHPNIVMAYDANEVNGERFLVMEYVEGKNLGQLLHERGPLPIRQACELMHQAALGLQYAHEKGMVHRDVKPANLLIPAQGGDTGVTRALVVPPEAGLRASPPLVKIADFGLARLLNPRGDTIQLQPGTFMGTPDYVSPEQCQDVHAVDIRSDLYSLGCTFYHALTGQPPYAGATLVEKLIQHAITPPPFAEQYRPDLPPALSALLRRLMAKDPEDRFQTPIELARALVPWCASGPANLPATPAYVPAEVAFPPPRPTRMVAPVEPMPRPAEEESPRPATEMILVQMVEQALRDRAEGDTAPNAVSTAELVEEKTEELSGDSVSTNDPGIDPVLCDHWQRWSELIAAFARGHGWGRWTEPSYRRLHEQVVLGCRQQASLGSADRRLFFQRLEEIVKPWISLDCLERTEAEILNSLVAHCRRVEPVFAVPRRWDLSWVVGLAAAVLGVAVLLFLRGR